VRFSLPSTDRARSSRSIVSCCPEAFVSILLCDKLHDDEIVILRGCRRFVDYVGYGETFRYRAHHRRPDATRIQDILVLDACFANQFDAAIVDRDLNKAWAAFDRSNDERIVTGHWGCGVFNGNFLLKFLQQICAAMLVGQRLKQLHYSVFGDQTMANMFQQLVEQLQKKNKTVADVYRIIRTYQQSKDVNTTDAEFHQFVQRWLDQA
jgi:poly(ADP-ribose) glycohydrolase